MASRPTPDRQPSRPGKSASFKDLQSEKSDRRAQIRRPESLPELLLPRRRETPEVDNGQRLRKLLLHVTVQPSMWPVHVMMSPEDTVADLIGTALEAYSKERRHPLVLEAADSSGFKLHYSQFSLESLDPKEKLINLGSRSFFLCMKPTKVAPYGYSDQTN